MKKKNIYFNHTQYIRFSIHLAPLTELFILKIILDFVFTSLIYLFTYLFTALFIYLLTYSLFISMTTEHKVPRFSFFVELSLYLCPHYFHQSSPIIFDFIFFIRLLGRIQEIEFERHDLPLPVRCMSKLFKVSINYFSFVCACVFFVLQRLTFCFCLFFKLSLATTTGVDACLFLSFAIT